MITFICWYINLYLYKQQPRNFLNLFLPEQNVMPDLNGNILFINNYTIYTSLQCLIVIFVDIYQQSILPPKTIDDSS